MWQGKQKANIGETETFINKRKANNTTTQTTKKREKK